MSFATLDGERLMKATVNIPLYGIFAADVVLASSNTIPDQTTLTLGDLALTVAVFRKASFAGVRSARVVGGYKGWRKTIPAQPYRNPVGVKLSTVLGDAARACGEKISVATDKVIGPFYIREAAPAQRVLRQLAGPLWWMHPNGTTMVAPRPATAIASPFQVINWSGATGKFQIASEVLADWLPGRTFTSTTVTTRQTITMTSIMMDNDGKLRLEVLTRHE